ncbi:3-hydroxyacyl-CoA dehydrogenase NAD-binding domain-containing protein [Actibacterium sp. D379-3]
MNASVVHPRRDGACALILIDNPPVNATSQYVRGGLLAAVEAAIADPAVAAMVIACEGRTFVAGAEIREFGLPPVDPHLSVIVDRIEQCEKPVVAAIHGTALGGGFELALGCHARIADRSAKVGLPEVKLGILPGAGGTQRVPRLAGVAAALDLIGSGRYIPATEALALGLIDAVAEGDLRAEATALALSLVGQAPRRASDLPVPDFTPAEFEKAAMQVFSRARGQLSPLSVIEAVRQSTLRPFRGGLVAERALFQALVGTDQARALRYAFFSERQVQREPDLHGVAARPLRAVGVIGAGTMGAGIAVALLSHGIRVTLVETDAAAADKGRARIDGLYDRLARSGRIDAEGRAGQLAQLRLSTRFDDLADTDFVIEAAPENMDIKTQIFARLGQVTRPGTVLATNTSYLDVNAIAAASGRPEDVIGMHFFSPANVMRLVEVVRGAASAKSALATGIALARRIGKLPVTCGVCDGFVGNRILSTWRQQADFALEDGVMPEEVDAALEAFGFAMGPFTVLDLAGLDVAAARRRRLYETWDPKVRYSGAIADRLCDMGRFGQKTGAGYYRYVDGTRLVDPAVTALIKSMAGGNAPARLQPFDAAALQRRVHAAMVNEGARILGEGIVSHPASIDMILVHGYGYPAWRGGPMYEADRLGLAGILDEVRGMHDRFGPGWEPAPLLEELAASGARFADWAEKRQVAG